MPVILKPSPEAIARARDHLAAGRLVAFPTETVYGLGADATNALAVARIFAAKGRPRFNPLIIHVGDLAAAGRLAELNAGARRLAEAFWPGPLTLVARQRPGCPVAALATAGLDTIAVRVPDHPVAAQLMAAAGVPLAAPSANRSGHVSPTRAAHVAADLGDAVALILDGGPTAIGLESTIVAVTGSAPVLLRAGGLTRERIEQVLGRALTVPSSAAGAAPTAPGQLASHYAPRARLRIDATSVAPDEALLAFGPPLAGHGGPLFNLSATGDLVEAAANLFLGLRTLDALGVARIAAMPVPEHGLGIAINDRLRRAAAPRP